MSFRNQNNIIRKIGRNIVLPVKKIKRIANKQIFEKKGINVDVCVDFGAGTLFWSDWLKAKCSQVFAVDVIYDKPIKKQNIKCVNSITIVEKELIGKTVTKLFWASDVLHHLDESFINQLLTEIVQTYEYIVIKDINCHKRVGNHLNRLHDKIINGEEIIDIDPNSIIDKLLSENYKVSFYEIRRLWYPHFLIVAKKNREKVEKRK